ncbi:MAG: glycosyltransferase [Acidimicrobiales bacterium]|nr:glycosyltransferase [Acidimicrobiales bacterium]
MGQRQEPEVFARALDRLAERGLDFRLVLAGQDAVEPSSIRADIRLRHGDRVLAAGPFDVDSYRNWVRRSDIVASCTSHEFFGIAVVEALAAGCRPVLPDGFSYPEIVPSGVDLYEPGRFGSALADAVIRFADGFDPIDVRRFGWSVRIDEYDSLIDGLSAG